ncbi:MAG: hypothetical protein DRI94_08335 [Bacteroidetes bacterium]|nr:MAG: hypothetical protein DRI94_08335 [Bacteroidota bacterium]
MNKVGIVDIVGIKGGMDYYDRLLGKAIGNYGNKTYIFSNFDIPNDNNIKYLIYFDKNAKSKTQKTNSLVSGIKKTISYLKKNEIKSVIFHIFSFNIVIFLLLKKLKTHNFNIIVILHDVNSLGEKNFTFFRKIILNKFVSRIIVHNSFSKHELSKILKTKKDIIDIIPHGNYLGLINNKIKRVDAIKKLGLNKDIKYILFFGQIKKTKGLDILLEALQYIKDNVQLIIAGKPWQTNFDIYDSFIERNNLNKKVIKKIYYIDNDERDLLFSASYICVIPYIKIYQSGVMLMSMSYGLPVIASDLTPNKEIIKDNKNGLLFKSKDSKNLSDKINILLSDNNLRKRISKESINTMKNYSWEQIAEKYNKLIT